MDKYSRHSSYGNGIRYDGNKGRLYKQLKPFLPSEFNAYIEPFVGGGGMFYSLVCDGVLDNVSYVFLNDKSKIIYYLFKYLLKRETNDELYNMAVNDFKNRPDWELYRDDVKNFAEKDQLCLLDAYKWLYHKYYGTIFGYADEYTHAKTQLLMAIKNMLVNKNVSLTCADAIKFVRGMQTRYRDGSRRNERPFYFIDPPYMNSATRDYKDEIFNVDDMAGLIKTIKKRMGKLYDDGFAKVMITHTRHSALENLLTGEGFKIHPLREFKDALKSGQEFVAINYDINDVHGELFCYKPK